MNNRNVSLAIIVLISALLILINHFTIRTTSAVRAYINGESRYSKGQKDGASYLVMYIHSGDSTHWNSFVERMKIPLGDSIARVGLLNNSEEEVIRQAFLQGENHYDDVDDMIWLFQNFKSISFMKQAIQIWKEADAKIGELVTLGERVRKKVASGSITPGEMERQISAVGKLSSVLTIKEREFSDVLGAAARTINLYLFYANIFLTLLLIGSAGRFWNRVLKRLSSANNRFKETLHFSKMGSGISDFKTQNVVFSPELLQIFDLPAKEPRNINILKLAQDFVLPEDRHIIRETLAQGMRGATEGGIEMEVEFRIKSAAGKEKLLNVKAQFQGQEGFGIVQDITARRNLELESINKGKRIENILFSFTDGFFAVNQEWQFTLVNPVYEKTFGQPVGSLLGKNLWEVFPSVRNTVADEKFRLALSSGISQHFELSSVVNAGLYYDVHVYPNNEGLFAYFRDITDQKLVNLALATTKEMLERVISGTNEAVWELDFKKNTLFFSDRWKEMFGYQDDDLKNFRSNWVQYFHPNEVQILSDALDETLINHRTKFDFECRLKHKKGHYVWTKLHTLLAFDEQGQPTKLTGANADIGERKLAEIALTEQNELFRKLSDNVPGIIFNLYLNDEGAGVFPFVSSGTEALLGIPAHVLMADAKPFFDLIHPEDSALVVQSIKQAFHSNQPWADEFRITLADGTFKWISVASNPYLEPDGKYWWYGFMNEVTAQKQTSHKLESLANSIPNGFLYEYCISPDGGYRLNHASKGCESLFEVSVDAAIQNVDALFSKIHLGDLQRFNKTVEQQAKESGKFEVDYRIVMSDNRIKWVKDIASVRMLADQSTVIEGVALDITRQKELEQQDFVAKAKLEQSENHLRAILNASTDSTIFIDSHGKMRIANAVGVKQIEQVYGKPFALGLDFEEMLPEEFKEDFRVCFNKALQGEVIEFDRKISLAATALWLQTRYLPVFDSQNQVIGVSQRIADITNRKVAEEKLKEREAKLLSIIENEPNCVKILNAKGELMDMNASGLKMIEAESLQQVLGNQMTAIMDEPFRKQFAALTKSVIGGIPQKMEFSITGLKGARRWLEMHAVPLKDETTGENVLLGITRDITRQKKHSQLLNTITDLQSVFITSTNPKVFFDYALNAILQLTESGYGFIGEVLLENGVPYLKTMSITNIAWNEEMLKHYNANAPQGLEFRILKSLFGVVMTSGKLLISNNPYQDSRRGGLPEGHPALNAFAGIPLFKGEELIGMLGLANRLGGYTHDDMAELKPLLETLSNIVEAYRNEKQRKDFESRLVLTKSRLELAIEASGLGIWDANLETGEITWDEGMVAIYGYKPGANILTKAQWEGFVHPEDFEHAQLKDIELLNGKGKTYKMNFRIIRQDNGDVRFVETLGTIDRDSDGRVVRMTGVNMDRTNEKVYENQLVESLSEKELLIREIHHRVKNNLQLISSILYIRMSNMQQSEIKDFLKDTRQKIRAIALIHERLLQSGSVNQIDIADYMGKLLMELQISSSHSALQLHFETDIESEQMNLDTAIYCGLIANELITNAIKHAFVNRTVGRINTVLKRTETGHFMRICNDGNSLPEDIAPGKTDSFGMQMLDIFIRQLGGTIEVAREKGTCFSIQFR